ncbi:PD-(D/E)XK nuclease family protein [bacterium]|nr:PD-(D/E)XK nuclease family protein [bacterium]
MIYSFSQIQTFLICPRRYQFQYLEKIPRKDPSYKLCL